MGLLIGGAVFPTAFAITWEGQTRAGAISGALSGLAAGLIAWLATAHQYFGAITVSTTGEEYSTLAGLQVSLPFTFICSSFVGNLAAIMTGLIVSVAVSLARPQPFSWELTRSINALSAPSSLGGKTSNEKAGDESPAIDEEAEVIEDLRLEEEPSKLRRAFKVACIASFLLTFIIDFLIPIPMFLSHYIFSQGFFTAWVVITFIWVFCSAAITTILPLVEAGAFFRTLAKEMMGR